MTVQVSGTIHSMDAAIDGARYIFDLKGNWDGEGAKAIAPATWRRAVSLLRHGVGILWDAYRIVLEPPRITPCADGSIDLYWGDPEAGLLINIGANETGNIWEGADDTVCYHGSHDPVRNRLIALMEYAQYKSAPNNEQEETA